MTVTESIFTGGPCLAGAAGVSRAAAICRVTTTVTAAVTAATTTAVISPPIYRTEPPRARFQTDRF